MTAAGPTSDAPFGHLAAIAHAFRRLAPDDVVVEVADVAARVVDAREAALVARAVEKRRDEFATGRWCAAQVLARVGAPSGPVLRGTFHEPLWPSGFTGSITHHGEVAVAAACAAGDAGRVAIGIDLADCSDLARYRQILPLICCEGDELGFVGTADPIAAAYLFSMKEAAVKCLSPTLKAFIELSTLSIRPAGSGCRVDHGGLRIFARSVRVGSFIATFASAD